MMFLKNFVASAKQAAGSKKCDFDASQGKGPSAVEKASIMAVCLEAAPMFNAPDLRLSGLKGSITIGGESFSPAKDPSVFLAAAGKQLKAAAGNATLMPF